MAGDEIVTDVDNKQYPVQTDEASGQKFFSNDDKRYWLRQKEDGTVLKESVNSKGSASYTPVKLSTRNEAPAPPKPEEKKPGPLMPTPNDNKTSGETPLPNMPKMDMQELMKVIKSLLEAFKTGDLDKVFENVINIAQGKKPENLENKPAVKPEYNKASGFTEQQANELNQQLKKIPAELGLKEGASRDEIADAAKNRLTEMVKTGQAKIPAGVNVEKLIDGMSQVVANNYDKGPEAFGNAVTQYIKDTAFQTIQKKTAGLEFDEKTGGIVFDIKPNPNNPTLTDRSVMLPEIGNVVKTDAYTYSETEKNVSNFKNTSILSQIPLNSLNPEGVNSDQISINAVKDYNVSLIYDKGTTSLVGLRFEKDGKGNDFSIDRENLQKFSGFIKEAQESAQKYKTDLDYQNTPDKNLGAEIAPKRAKGLGMD